MIHGGGFVIGSVESEHAGAALMAIDTGAVVVSVDYRLAPELRTPPGCTTVRRAVVPARRGRSARRRSGPGGSVGSERRGWAGRGDALLPAIAVARRSASSCCRSPSSTTGWRRAPWDLRRLAHVEPASGRAELAGLSRPVVRGRGRAALRRASPADTVGSAPGLRLDGRERSAARRGDHLRPAPVAGRCLGGAAPVPRDLPRLRAGDIGDGVEAGAARVALVLRQALGVERD